MHIIYIIIIIYTHNMYIYITTTPLRPLFRGPYQNVNYIFGTPLKCKIVC